MRAALKPQAQAYGRPDLPGEVEVGRGTRIPRPKKPFRPCEVDWLDAATEENADLSMQTMRTVGYYVFKGVDVTGTKIVRLASDCDGDHDNRSFHVIPVAQIKRLTYLIPEVAP